MTEKTLYLECYSGISGDMTVAALLDLGADQKVLLSGLKSLNVDGYKINISRKNKGGIDACDFDVILENDTESERNQSLSEDLPEHLHVKLGHHENRNLYDIITIIDNSAISVNAKEIAKKIFHIDAVAEAKAHGNPIEKVYFHELGAVDSIVDIVSAAICLDNLGIKEVIVTEVYDGTGHIKCRNGMLPVPVPAVVNIVADYNIPLHITDIIGELVTPTGAAIAAAIRTRDHLPAEFKIKKIGLGAGKREYKQPSILRAMIIEVLA
jgi:uncharacterized protein (TIGR00299 family) protein